MKHNLTLSSYALIRKHQVMLNGNVFFEDDPELKMTAFFKNIYKKLGIDYPKYFKMDALCKLGFLGAEVLVANNPSYQNFKSEDVGMVFANASSSLDTDLKYQETIENDNNYFPSPSLFVYTLPNIMIGEISIRHKMSGENIFIVAPSFDPQQMYDSVAGLFNLGLVNNVMCAWVDVFKNQYEALLFFVKKEEKTNESINFEPESLQKIYFLNR